MGRPRGSKNKATTTREPGKSVLKTTKTQNKIIGGIELDTIIIDELAKVEPREIKRFCPICDGILFGGQIIHKKGCRNYGTK